MKALLMHRDRDFNLQQALPWNQSVVTQDLELGTLLYAMAGDDKFLFDVARVALLSGLENDVETVLYRQEAVTDCLANPLCANMSETSSPSTITVGRGKKSHFDNQKQDKQFFRCVGSFGA